MSNGAVTICSSCTASGVNAASPTANPGGPLPVWARPNGSVLLVPSIWTLLNRSCCPAKESPPLGLTVTCGASSASVV
jgi:hypothetical protein